MCTLIAGIDLIGPRTLVLGANRDESPERASDGPGVLRERPRVVGGRDRVAGGTWLAIREARAITALMNRRVTPGTAPPAGSATPRSRGLLCLDAATSGLAADSPALIDPGTGERHAARLHSALSLIARGSYAACTLVGLDLEEPSWALLAEAGTETGVRLLEPGWHVLTHADVDDPNEPRTAWLVERLRGFFPKDSGEALDGLAGLLRTHADLAHGVPGVCLHRDRFPTVSSSLIALGEVGAPRYLHAPGPPCTTPYDDVSKLLG